MLSLCILCLLCTRISTVDAHNYEFVSNGKTYCMAKSMRLDKVSYALYLEGHRITPVADVDKNTQVSIDEVVLGGTDSDVGVTGHNPLIETSVKSLITIKNANSSPVVFEFLEAECDQVEKLFKVLTCTIKTLKTRSELPKGPRTAIKNRLLAFQDADQLEQDELEYETEKIYEKLRDAYMANWNGKFTLAHSFHLGSLRKQAELEATGNLLMSESESMRFQKRKRKHAECKAKIAAYKEKILMQNKPKHQMWRKQFKSIPTDVMESSLENLKQYVEKQSEVPVEQLDNATITMIREIQMMEFVLAERKGE